MPIASFHTTLPDGAGAPEWVHLLPAGTFTGADGRGPFRLRDPEAVIRASMASGRLAIDENHSTDLATPRGEPSPARGWIVEMRARPDGLWGQVEWTPTGATLMTEKAYRGLSPVFERSKDGTITRVLRAALTNVPNLTLTSLNTQQDTEMDLKALRTALGLAETADEAAILAAITANATAVVRHTAQIEAIRAAAALPASLTVEGIATELQTRRAAAGNADQLAAQVQQLEHRAGDAAVGRRERTRSHVRRRGDQGRQADRAAARPLHRAAHRRSRRRRARDQRAAEHQCRRRDPQCRRRGGAAQAMTNRPPRNG